MQHAGMLTKQSGSKTNRRVRTMAARVVVSFVVSILNLATLPDPSRPTGDT
jgi:hypothetical protein